MTERTQLIVLGNECNLLISGKHTLLFDCGISFTRDWGGLKLHPIIRKVLREYNKRRAYGPDFSLMPDGEKVANLVHLHGHFDHCGFTPGIEKANRFTTNAKAWGAPQTNELLAIHFKETMRRSPYLYNRLHVRRTLKRMRVIPLGEFRISKSYTCYVVPNGHIPGSVSCIVRVPGGRKYLFMGDICFHDQEIVKGAKLLSRSVPEEWLPDGILSADPFSLFGSPHPSEDPVEKLADAIAANPTKRFLIATLSVGRQQIFALGVRDALRRRGVDIPLWADGIGIVVFGIFRKRWSELDREFSTEGIRFVSSVEERERLAQSTEPAVIFSSAGMEDVGAIAAYLPHFLPVSDYYFATSSHLPKGSKHLLIQKESLKESGEVTIGEQTVPIRCKVLDLRKSAHADREQTYLFLEDLVRARGKKLKIMVVRVPDGMRTGGMISRLRKDITEEIIVSAPGTTLTL